MKNEFPRRVALIYKTFSVYPSSLLVYLWIKRKGVYYLLRQRGYFYPIKIANIHFFASRY